MGLVGWKYKREIQLINTTSLNLENYIVRITLDSSNFDFSKPKPDGSDIRFTDSDGTTLLGYYIEDYDYNSQEATIWIKVPLISANQTKSIYMYYGNMNAVSQSDESVITSGLLYDPDPFNDGSCVAFYPFDGDANDYSGNGYHGTWHGNEQYDDGLFGQAVKIVSSYICNTDLTFGNQVKAISLWFKEGVAISNEVSSSVSNRVSVYTNYNTGTQKLYIQSRSRDGSGAFENWRYRSVTIDNVDDSIFHHLTFVFVDPNTYLLFFDGNSIDFTVTSSFGLLHTPGQGFVLGRYDYNSNVYYVDGVVDHVHIFNRALTDDEISLLSTHIPPTILDEVQVKSRASGVIVDINGNPIINTPIKIYLLNPDTGHLVDSTDCNTDASWEINDVPADPGEEVISVFKSNDSSQKLTGAGVVVTQEVNE